tara:strand:- start:670 stop:864 length:195 start_codon:yes stop_codon:yes gene_type:complete
LVQGVQEVQPKQRTIRTVAQVAQVGHLLLGLGLLTLAVGGAVDLLERLRQVMVAQAGRELMPVV